MSGRFGKGWKPNPASHVRTFFGACRWTVDAAAAAATPASMSLESFAPEVLDQGQTGSCTGHGTATALYTSFVAAGVPLKFIPSPAEIYRNGRAIDRVPRSDGTFALLTDDGAEPNQVIRAVQTIGIRPMRAPTKDGRYSDVEPSTVNDNPMLGDVMVERLTVPIGERGIQSVGAGASIDEVVLLMRQALAAGFAICKGNFVDTDYENWSPSKGPMGACDLRDPNGGGHWTTTLGYYTDASGRTIFIDRGSWGRAYGLNGNVEVLPAFIAQAQDITAFVPELAKGAS